MQAEKAISPDKSDKILIEVEYSPTELLRLRAAAKADGLPLREFLRAAAQDLIQRRKK